MKTLTSLDDYRDQAVFEREQTRLFEKAWHFAGFTSDLSNDGDYIVAQAGGKSVLVRNFAGELRGFLNVCSHRFSAIRRECKGHGLLQCQYHGWVYDRDGYPSGIAQIKEFDDITEQRRQELQLAGWDVEACGSLVFVRDAVLGGPGLREYLGTAWPVIETFTSSMGEQIDCNRMTIHANWKVVVENTLESYHVRSIHPETFATLSARTREFRFDGPHSSWTADIDATMAARMAKLTRRLGIASSFDAYFHQLVFPNLTLATTSGLTYAVQLILPVDPATTDFTSYVFSARSDAPAAHKQILAESSRPAVEFNRAVFEEDRLVCEQVQHGIRQAGSNLTGELSREEQRVYQFQSAWGAAIDKV